MFNKFQYSFNHLLLNKQNTMYWQSYSL